MTPSSPSHPISIQISHDSTINVNFLSTGTSLVCQSLVDSGASSSFIREDFLQRIQAHPQSSTVHTMPQYDKFTQASNIYSINDTNNHSKSPQSLNKFKQTKVTGFSKVRINNIHVNGYCSKILRENINVEKLSSYDLRGSSTHQKNSNLFILIKT